MIKNITALCAVALLATHSLSATSSYSPNQLLINTSYAQGTITILNTAQGQKFFNNGMAACGMSMVEGMLSRDLTALRQLRALNTTYAPIKITVRNTGTTDLMIPTKNALIGLEDAVVDSASIHATYPDVRRAMWGALGLTAAGLALYFSRAKLQGYKGNINTFMSNNAYFRRFSDGPVRIAVGLCIDIPRFGLARNPKIALTAAALLALALPEYFMKQVLNAKNRILNHATVYNPATKKLSAPQIVDGHYVVPYGSVFNDVVFAERAKIGTISAIDIRHVPTMPAETSTTVINEDPQEVVATA